MNHRHIDIMAAAMEGLEYIKDNPKRALQWWAVALVPMLVIGGVLTLVTFGRMDAVEGDWFSLAAWLVTVPMSIAVGSTILGRTRGKTWLNLRIGKDEGLFVAATVLSGIALIAYGIAGALAVVAVWSIQNVVAVVMAVLLIGFAIWLMIRVSLFGVASVDLGRLALLPAWRATRGQFWPMLGVSVMIGLIMGLIVLILVVIAAIIFGIGYGLVSMTGMGAGAGAIMGIPGFIGLFVLITMLLMAQQFIYAVSQFVIWKRLRPLTEHVAVEPFVPAEKITDQG